MKHFLLSLVMLSATFLNAQSSDYKKLIATDRFILMFNQNVSTERKAEIIQSSALVTSFTHLPAPALTICFSKDVVAAQKYFNQNPDVKFVSFFLTDGKYYAGVLDQFFVKLKDPSQVRAMGEKISSLGLYDVRADKYIPNLYIVKNTEGRFKNTLELCENFKTANWCQYAVPDYLINPEVCSNDPLFNREWNIKNSGTSAQGSGTPGADMDVDSAWTLTTGDASIKVAVIDAGVDTLHPDLVDNMLPGHDAAGDTTNGYPTPNYAEDGHGTCCAGIVAAVKDNGIGCAGVAPSCKIIPVHTFYYIELSNTPPAIPYSTAGFFADAIGWAWSEGHADIMTNSWGLTAQYVGLLLGGTQPVEDAIQAAHVNGRNGKGVALFFSSGNEIDSTGPIWPAKLTQTIAINATNMCDTRKSLTDCSGEVWAGNYGPGLDFSAPGVKITTTDMRGNKGFANGDYTYTFNGTSAACPNAAAVGALLLSIRPDLTAEDIRNIIARTCDKVGGYAYDSILPNGAWSHELGYGRVNAYKAVQLSFDYVSSVKETGATVDIKVFPNPASGWLNILNDHSNSGIVRLYNATGQLLRENKIEKGLNTLEVSSLAPGIYLVRIITESADVTRKVTLIR